VYWWHVAERQKTDKPTMKSGEPVLRDVPVAFAAELAEVLRRRGIKGKFSVLPYPAGLGSISQGLKGYSQADVDRWLAIVRREIVPRMDITPEILTHSKTLDLATRKLLSENEREWSTHQTADTLTPYIAEALKILKEVDLPATGVTSPWDFGSKVEPEYQRAIMKAQQQVNARRKTWYFLHQSSQLSFQSKVVHRDAAGWLVSIVSQCPDVFWQTMETKETSEAYVRSIADLLLTEDGQRGRMADLYRAGTPVVMLTHWQSLFSNGRKTGLRVLDEVGRRVQTAWGKRARWVTCSELAEQIAAGPQPKAGPCWPLMRQTNYLALLGKAGAELCLEIESRQVSKLYADELQYSILAAGGRTLADGRIGLGEKQSLVVKTPSKDLLALELAAGWNGCTVDAGSTPSAFIASEMHPLHVVGVNGPLYFYVPRGCRRFGIQLTAGAPREGARLVVRTPDGQAAREEEGDFDTRVRIPIDVPKEAAGQVWSLSLEKPKAKGLHADDVTISLDSSVAPYLAKRTDWALEFGRRRHP
jgi:hypothetical protein